jgi:protein-tyrosine phosphatase
MRRMKISRLAAVLVTPAVAFAALAVTAPVASAQPAHAAESQHIPFTEATVTAASDGSFTIVWNAPGTHRVVIRANGHTVATGGTRGEAVVRAGGRRVFPGLFTVLNGG